MPEDDNNFSKQRRNLMWISSILIFHQFLNVKYEEIDLFKAGIKIGSPENIPYVLWGLWLYFLYRYMALFFEQGDKGWRAVKSYYESSLIKKSKYKGRKETGRDLDNASFNRDDRIFFKQRISYAELVPKSGKYETVLIYEHEYNCPHSISIYGISFIKSIFRNHYFSEYYIPLIWAAIPILVWLPQLMSAILS